MDSKVISIEEVRSRQYRKPLTEHMESAGIPNFAMDCLFEAIDQTKIDVVAGKAEFHIAAQKYGDESRLIFCEGGERFFTFAWVPEPNFIVASLLCPKLKLCLDTPAETTKFIMRRTVMRYMDDKNMLPAGRAVGAHFFRLLYLRAAEIYHAEQEGDESAFIGSVEHDGAPSIFLFETLNSTTPIDPADSQSE